MKWLVDEEKVILERLDEMIDQGDNVTMSDVKKLRSSIRVPALFRDV